MINLPHNSILPELYTRPTTLVEAYDTLTQVEKEAILSKILDVCIEEHARKNKTLMYRLMEEHGLSNLDN